MSDIPKIRELCVKADGGLGPTAMLVSVMPMVLDELTTARQCIKDLAAALHKMCEHNSPGIVYGQDALVHHAKTIEECK